jgi:predicted TPR repeat methyltransferase
MFFNCSPLFSLDTIFEALMNTTVSILAEIPEELHLTLTQYLETHAEWDQDRVFAAALSLFLLQNGECDRQAALVYLDTLFKHAV